jgi:hypothetical protein
MQVSSVNGLQQLTETVPLPYRPDYQLALLDRDVDCRTSSHLRLNGK